MFGQSGAGSMGDSRLAQSRTVGLPPRGVGGEGGRRRLEEDGESLGPEAAGPAAGGA